MTQPSARILAHSRNGGYEIVTFEITCHRWILAELNTHRKFSRNFRSSRAVPFSKLLQEVREQPAMPVEWRKNQAGMVGGSPMNEEEEATAKEKWLKVARLAADQAEEIASTGIHKQWVNRILEPYLMVHGVITGTEWNNFYALRRASDAQPEFKALADAMYKAYTRSFGQHLPTLDWHLPYITHDEKHHYPDNTLNDISAARVARVSIKPHDENSINIDKDLDLANKLMKAKHMSPFEHQATPDPNGVFKGHWGNLVGFIQYRKLIPNEWVPG